MVSGKQVIIALAAIGIVYVVFFSGILNQIFAAQPKLYQLAGRDAWCKGTLNRQAPDIKIGHYYFEGVNFRNVYPDKPSYDLNVYKRGILVQTVNNAQEGGHEYTIDGITFDHWDQDRCFTPCDPRYCSTKCAAVGQGWLLIRYEIKIDAPAELFEFEIVELVDDLYQIKITNNWLTARAANVWVTTDTGEKILVAENVDIEESKTAELEVSAPGAFTLTPSVDMQLNFNMLGSQKLSEHGILYTDATGTCANIPGSGWFNVGSATGEAIQVQEPPAVPVEQPVEQPTEQPVEQPTEQPTQPSQPTQQPVVTPAGPNYTLILIILIVIIISISALVILWKRK